MTKVKDLSGKRYTRLVVIRRVGSKNKRSYWECLCDCGNTKLFRSNQLTSGVKSCGCLRDEMSKARTLTHGEGGKNESAEHRTWKAMLSRCFNPNHKAYHRYNGRGITVCERWMKYENFLSDMGRKPNMHTLERKNNNGNYEPNNCKWATYKEQANNTRVNNLVTHNKITKTIGEWSDQTGIPYKTLWYRLCIGKWETSKAFIWKG
jgi:hypothetical protein